MSGGTSKVIDTLHQTIDDLTLKLSMVTTENTELKHQKSTSTKRIGTLIEQLSNAKHQADVAESLLKRKERRVIDLDLQLTETLSELDTLKYEIGNLKTQLNGSQNQERSLQAENELYRNQYDFLVKTMDEFKAEKREEINDLRKKLNDFVTANEKTLAKNIDFLKLKEPEIILNYEKIIHSNKRMENIYAKRQELLNNSLNKLAAATIKHGKSTQIVLDKCEAILEEAGKLKEVTEKVDMVEIQDFDSSFVSDDGYISEIQLHGNEDDLPVIDAPLKKSTLSLNIPISITADTTYTDSSSFQEDSDSTASNSESDKSDSVLNNNNRQANKRVTSVNGSRPIEVPKRQSRQISTGSRASSSEFGLERRVSTKRNQRKQSYSSYQSNSYNNSGNTYSNGNRNHSHNIETGSDSNYHNQNSYNNYQNNHGNKNALNGASHYLNSNNQGGRGYHHNGNNGHDNVRSRKNSRNFSSQSRPNRSRNSSNNYNNTNPTHFNNNNNPQAIPPLTETNGSS